METVALLEFGWTVAPLIGLLMVVRLGHSKVLDLRSTQDSELRLIGLRTLRTYLGIAGVFAIFAILGFRALTIPPAPNPLDHWALFVGGCFIALEIYLTGLVIWLDRTGGKLRAHSRELLHGSWGSIERRRAFQDTLTAYLRGELTAEQAIALQVQLRHELVKED